MQTKQMGVHTALESHNCAATYDQSSITTNICYVSKNMPANTITVFFVVRPTLMGTKSLYENGPDPLFCVLFNLMGTRMVQIRKAKSVWAFRKNITNGFGAQIRLRQRYKTANGFRTRRNCYYIRPITLLELKYIVTSARNAAAIAEGMVELFFYSREERTLAARSEVLEMLEVVEDRWFGRLDDDSPKVKWMRRVYPRVDYTQAPWTVAGTVDGCCA